MSNNTLMPNAPDTKKVKCLIALKQMIKTQIEMSFLKGHFQLRIGKSAAEKIIHELDTYEKLSTQRDDLLAALQNIMHSVIVIKGDEATIYASKAFFDQAITAIEQAESK